MLLAVIAIVVLAIRLGWANTEPAGSPEFGINFSCNQAEFLLLEEPGRSLPDDRPGREAWCADTLGILLDGLGVRRVRLSVEWSQVEPHEGVFDFGLLDALLSEAELRGARVLLTVGVKAQRHPEFYIPSWAEQRADLAGRSALSDDPYLRERILRMIAAVVEHAARSPAVDAWGAENEPYLASHRAQGWYLARDFVAEEIRTIKANDPLGRPVSVNHGQHFVFDRRWQWAIADADVLGQSLYPFRNVNVLGLHFVVPILELGPLTPNYAYQGREAREAGGDFWITEMQAEPWTDDDLRLITPANPSRNLTPGNFRRNIDYARRTGASRVYFWGAEWWLYQRERFGDSTWWEIAREAIQRGLR